MVQHPPPVPAEQSCKNHHHPVRREGLASPTVSAIIPRCNIRLRQNAPLGTCSVEPSDTARRNLSTHAVVRLLPAARPRSLPDRQKSKHFPTQPVVDTMACWHTLRPLMMNGVRLWSAKIQPVAVAICYGHASIMIASVYPQVHCSTVICDGIWKTPSPTRFVVQKHLHGIVKDNGGDTPGAAGMESQRRGNLDIVGLQFDGNQRGRQLPPGTSAQVSLVACPHLLPSCRSKFRFLRKLDLPALFSSSNISSTPCLLFVHLLQNETYTYMLGYIGTQRL